MAGLVFLITLFQGLFPVLVFNRSIKLSHVFSDEIVLFHDLLQIWVANLSQKKLDVNILLQGVTPFQVNKYIS